MRSIGRSIGRFRARVIIGGEGATNVTIVWGVVAAAVLGQASGAEGEGELSEQERAQVRQIVGTLLELSYSRTPLQPAVARFVPHLPAERITVHKTPEGHRVRVHINAARPNLSRDAVAQAPITAEELESLAVVLVRAKLAEWKPQTADTFRSPWIDSLRIVREGYPPIEFLWYRPLANDDQSSQVRDALARLAQTRLPRLPVEFLRPSP